MESSYSWRRGGSFKEASFLSKESNNKKLVCIRISVQKDMVVGEVEQGYWLEMISGVW